MMCHISRYACAGGPRHEIAPHGLHPHQHVHREPYIYSDRHIADLIGAAKAVAPQLPGATWLGPLTFATLLELPAVAGMRSTRS